MTAPNHDELARRIYDELTAVMGPLRSDHLDRCVGVGDMLDAVHLATDDDDEEPTTVATKAAQLTAAIKLAQLIARDQVPIVGTDGASMSLPRELVYDIIDALERVSCQFWACEGPTLKPIPMKTCFRCYTLARVRRLYGR